MQNKYVGVPQSHTKKIVLTKIYITNINNYKELGLNLRLLTSTSARYCDQIIYSIRMHEENQIILLKAPIYYLG